MIKSNKKTVNAWAFYDWANSVYPLVVTTAIFPIYYSAVTDDEILFLGIEFKNMELYSYGISISFLVVAFISPFLSGIADYLGNKKYFLKLFCTLGSISTASLFFFSQAYIEWSMLVVVLASVGFWGSLVFYNAYLPEIAPPEEHDQISAKGYALGYIGSSILLIIILIAIQGFEMPAKWAFPIVGAWWFISAHITYPQLPEDKKTNAYEKGVLVKGFAELNKVLAELKHLKALKTYLISFFLFSIGVQTVMQLATLFAIEEIDDMPDSGLIISILIIQFIAVGGAYLFSSISKMIGNIKAIAIALVVWIAVCVIAYLIHSAIGFYLLAGLVGLVMGGIQSLARSTYSKLLPPTKDTASFFSFYDVTEKIGVVIGTFSFAWIVGYTGSMRTAVLFLLIFFVMGLVALLWMPKSNLEQQTS